LYTVYTYITVNDCHFPHSQLLGLFSLVVEFPAVIRRAGPGRGALKPGWRAGRERRLWPRVNHSEVRKHLAHWKQQMY